jgi:mannose-6-phosphate isomerase
MQPGRVKPSRLTPRFLEKVWGSTRLQPWFPNSDRKIGEVWFHTEDIPLLVKFLFTTDKLSVQVHPGDEYARIHHNSAGKTEMWHVLAAEPGARIAAGFREPLDETRLKTAALSGEIEGLLEWVEARPGDTFFIPAGTVHAIGGGLSLLEIQQHSDVTYRLYDYGRPRELHLDHAAATSHRRPHVALQKPSGETLVSCDYFHTSRITINGSQSYRPGGSSELLVFIEGSGELNRESTQAGDVWHVPAGAQACEVQGNVTVLVTRAKKPARP